LSAPPPPEEHEAFYAELTLRNAGLIAPEIQAALQRTRIVVAGCGSTGGAVLMPLVRTGAEHFVLFDPGAYELNNLNRQEASVADVGRNKARASAERVLAVNPFCTIEVHEEGVQPESIVSLLREGDMVFDAIDVTTSAGIAAKLALHDAAAGLRLTVITAYDIATTQFIEIFDYRRVRAPLAGRIKRRDATPEQVLRALVPPFVLPREIFGALLQRRRDPKQGFPQLAMTSTFLGALAVEIALRLLANKPVRRRIHVDLADLARPLGRRAADDVVTKFELIGLWRKMR
jgi:molybdopterin/thiamine biosynthesis adenylyltransferase